MSSAIERAGPHGGADCEEGGAEGFDSNIGGFEEEGQEGEDGGEGGGGEGKDPRDNEGQNMAAERGLCRLVQASSAAASGAAR